VLKRQLAIILLSFLIVFGFLVSSVKAVTVLIEPPTLLNIDGVPVTAEIPRTTNRTPTLIGSCNLPTALMDFEMRTTSVLGASVADNDGLWRWTVPQQLSYGLHTLFVTATDPNDSTNTEASTYRIEITRSGVAIVRLGLPWLLGGVILMLVGFIGFKRFKKRAYV